MKVTRYDIDMEHETMPSGISVLATDYYALLALARKLRGALIFDYGREPLSNGTIDQNCQCAKCKALRDSAWLEEREE